VAPGAVIPDYDPEPEQSLPGLPAFSAFLSSQRAVLIRGDDQEGRTKVTALASDLATFEWQVDPQDGFLSVSEPTSVESETAVSGSQILIEVVGDPGPTGRTIMVTATATQEGTEETDTRSLQILAVRPKGALTVSVSAARSRVAPGREITVTALVTGGEPFVNGSAGDGCTGTDTASPPDQNPPYRITWSFSNDAVILQEGVPDDTEFRVNCLQERDELTISTAVYKAPVGLGTAIFTAEARDSTGNRIASTVPVAVAPDAELTVSQASSASTAVPPGGEVQLTARASGGEGPYRITFTASGGIEGADISRVSGGITLTRELTDGCQNVESEEACIVSYSAPNNQEGGELVSVSIQDRLGSISKSTIPLIITSEDALQVFGISDAVRVDPGGTTDVTAVVAGGTPPYTVTFANAGNGSISGEGLSTIETCGEPAPGIAAIDGNIASAVYNAPLEVTSDVITLTVCDNVGNRTSNSLSLTIAPERPLSVDLTSDAIRVEPGGTTTITAAISGGTGPYTVTFAGSGTGTLGGANLTSMAACDGGGSGVGIADTDQMDVVATYLAPVAITNEVVDATVCDSAGNVARGSVALTITTDTLVASASAQPSATTPGGDPVTITVLANGGTTPYSYTASLEAGGPGGSVTMNATTGQGQYTPPADAVGTAVIRIAVEDAAKQKATTFVNVGVAVDQVLSATLFASNSIVGTLECTELTATIIGGVQPYSVEFRIEGTPPNLGCLVDPADLSTLGCTDADANFPDTPCVPGSTLTFDVPSASGQEPVDVAVGFKGPGVNTTNIVRVTVTDKVNARVEAATGIIIGSPAQLSVALSANPRTVINNPNANVCLVADVTGGSPPYILSWQALPSGAGAFEDPTAACPGATKQWHPFGQPADPGDYTLRLTVTDSQNQQVTDSVAVTVVSAMTGEVFVAPPAVKTGPNAYQVTIGQTVELELPVSGGVGQPTYLWKFIGTAPTSGFVPGPTDSSPSFVADSALTYTVRCTVTDQAGNQYIPTPDTTVEAIADLKLNPVVDADCIVGLPDSLPNPHGPAALDPSEIALHANATGGVGTLDIEWTASRGSDPADGQDTTWTVVHVNTETSVTFNVTATDDANNSVTRSVSVPIHPGLELTNLALSADPLDVSVNDTVDITFVRDLTTGTPPLQFRITEVPGNDSGVGLFAPAAWTEFADGSDSGSIQFILADMPNGTISYFFNVEFTDDCSDAVVSHQFRVRAKK